MSTSTRDIELVQAAFRRSLSERERARLEAALVGSEALAERYRRLQLAERVAQHGPEAALERPSAAEVDRIAARLGLLEPAPRRVGLWRPAPWLFGALAVGAALLLFAVTPVEPEPEPDPELVMRGGDQAFGATVYAASLDGRFVRLEDGARVTSGDRLKLRVGAAADLEAVWVAVAHGPSGEPAVAVSRLGAPDPALGAVPGVVGLDGLTPGPITVYVLGATSPLDAGALEAAARARPSAEALGAHLGAGVEAWSLVLAPAEEAVPR